MRFRIFATGLFAALFAGTAPAQLNQIYLPPGTVAVPLTNPVDWIRPADFPVALHERFSGSKSAGTTWVKLDVSRGMVTACATTRSSGTPELDALACTLLTERARFKPAANKAYMKAVEWNALKFAAANPLPRIRLAEPIESPSSWVDATYYPESGSAGVAFRVEIDAGGNVVNCVAKSGNANARQFEKATCLAVSHHAKFWPALDQDGNPTFGVYKDRMFWAGTNTSARSLENAIAQPRQAPDLSFALAKKDMPAGWLSISVGALVVIGPDGATKHCWGGMTLGIPYHPTGPGPYANPAPLDPVSAAVCQRLVETWKIKPVQDKGGHPVPSVQKVSVLIEPQAVAANGPSPGSP